MNTFQYFAGQLNPNNLSQLDAFLSVLIGKNTSPKTEKTSVAAPKSAIDWLEELAKIGGVGSIEDPVEWQRSVREFLVTGQRFPVGFFRARAGFC